MKPRFFVSAAALALAACNANADQHPAPPPVAVDTTRVHRQTMATYENLDGAVVPYLQSSVSTQQSGTIVRVYANEGDRVRAGETLAKIDDSPLQAQLVQQRGTASQAQARLGQQAQSAYVAAQQTLKIDTEKIAQANAALAQARRKLLNTPLQRQIIAENRGAVTTAAGQLQLTQTQIGQTTLAAPFDGVVTQRLLDPGAYAGPNQPLFAISQVDPVYVTFNAKDEDLAYVAPGTLVSLAASAHPGRRYDAHVVSVNAVPTSGTLLYRARLVLHNPDESLRGGMLVTVRVTKAVHPDALVVPRGAVLQDGPQSSVFLVAPAPRTRSSPAPQPSGSPLPAFQAVRAAVTVGLQSDSFVEISSPKIHAGTEVIASRPDTVQDKTPIRPNTSRPAQRASPQSTRLCA